MKADEIYSLEWTNNVKVNGRAFVYNNCLWLSYSGTGVEFVCNNGFEARIVSDMIDSSDTAGAARICVLKDGAQILEEMVDNSQLSLEIRDEGVHTYSVIKLSESFNSSVGIREIIPYGTIKGDDGDEKGLVPVEDNRMKVEFIGNSITCGYGVEGDLSQTFTTATENVMKAWPYVTAKKLNADYSIVSKSGAGIISGYTATGERNTDNIITRCYDVMGCTQYTLDGKVGPADFEYDYSFDPDVIVVLLGTNDISFCHPVDENGTPRLSEAEEKTRRKEFYTEYKRFILHIREKNPLSKIVCALGVMGDALNEEVNMAVSEICAEGDSRIFMLPLEPQDPEDGYGTDYHPSHITQKKVADAVANYILGKR